MRRREFIALLGTAAIGWPVAVRAEQPTKPVIGFLHFGSAGPFAYQTRAFDEGLKETGYVEGENVTIEYRWADGRYDRLPKLAADLVGRSDHFRAMDQPKDCKGAWPQNSICRARQGRQGH
jgi:putative tryptophan/tyrosine transport system substrate-binding protein